jgi:hypothetical protein
MTSSSLHLWASAISPAVRSSSFTSFWWPFGADGEEGGVQEQRRDANLVEVAPLERLEALAQLLADPRRSTSRACPARPSRTATRRRASTGHARRRRSLSPATARCEAPWCRAQRASRRTARRPRGPAGSRPRARPRASAPCAADDGAWLASNDGPQSLGTSRAACTSAARLGGPALQTPTERVRKRCAAWPDAVRSCRNPTRLARASP